MNLKSIRRLSVLICLLTMLLPTISYSKSNSALDRSRTEYQRNYVLDFEEPGFKKSF